MVESRGKNSMCTLYRETLYVYDSIGCERHSITVCVSVCVHIYGIERHYVCKVGIIPYTCLSHTFLRARCAQRDTKYAHYI